ncbi:MAG: glycosyltransferase family 39 protein [bacterium]|nr:glycosyltransferase family 39 protein [bacterium]
MISYKGKQNILLFSFIILIAFVLRIWGVNFGLPSLFHFDERVIAYNALYTLSHKGMIHFGYFYGNLIPSLVGILYGIYYVVLKISGIIKTPFGFLVLYMQDPTTIYLIGRIFFVVIGVLCVVALYLLSRKLYNNTIAVASGILFSTCFLAIHQSKIMKGDTFGTLFLLLSIYFCSNQGLKIKKYLFAGIFMGIAIAARFSLLIGIVSPIFIILTEKTVTLKDRLKNCIILIGISMLIFFICTPSLIFDSRNFIIENYGVIFTIEQWPNVNTGTLPVWLFYLVEYFRKGIGLPLEIMGLIGILYSLYRKEDISFIIFLALYFGIVLNQPLSCERYLIPVIPFFILFASKFIYEIVSKLKISFLARNIIIGITLIGLMFPNLLNTIKYNYLITRQDTRNIGLKFVESNILPGSKIVCENSDEGFEQTGHLGLQLHKSKKQLEEQLVNEQKNGKYNKYLEAMIKGQREPTYALKNVLVLEKEDYRRKECYKNVDEYVEQGIEYLITSSWAKNQYVGNDLPKNFIDSLNDRYELIKEFKPYPLSRWDYYSWRVDYEALSKVSIFDKNVTGGPIIGIYKRKEL